MRPAILLLGLWVLGSTSALAATPCPPDDPPAVASEDHILFGEDLRVARCEHLHGDVVVLFGDAQVEGVVHGDLVVVFGDLSLGASAQVKGDVAALSGTIQQTPQTLVLGDRVQLPELGVSLSSLAGRLSDPTAEPPSGSEPSISVSGKRSLSNPLASQPLWLRLTTAVLSSLLLFLVGHFFLWIAPQRARNLRRTLEASPGASLLMGAVVTLALGLLSSVLLISIVGWAALPFIGLGATSATALGMGGLLEALGDRVPLPHRLRSRSADLVLGALILTALSCIWALGGLTGGIAAGGLAGMGFAAIGAAVLSSLGKRAYSSS